MEITVFISLGIIGTLLNAGVMIKTIANVWKELKNRHQKIDNLSEDQKFVEQEVQEFVEQSVNSSLDSLEDTKKKELFEEVLRQGVCIRRG
jgi:predicted transcriptional regulator